jgi:4'-phosphopantetheinyl transferase
LNKLASLHHAALATQSWQALERDWLPRLPEARRERLLKLRDPADRAASLLGVALLAAALRSYGLELPAGLPEYPKRGRPRLPGGPEFSISHAGGVVACVLAPERVGLDLELRAAARPEQLRLVLDPGERAAILAGSLDATDAWVMKEAVLKADGRGLAGARDVLLHGRTALLDGTVWCLQRVDVGPAHVAWLASEDRDLQVRVVATRPAEARALPA